MGSLLDLVSAVDKLRDGISDSCRTPLLLFRLVACLIRLSILIASVTKSENGRFSWAVRFRSYGGPLPEILRGRSSAARGAIDSGFG